MEKEFVSYEQALALKELGFDEICLAFWDGKNTDAFYFNNIRDASGDYTPFQKHDRLKWFGAPLYQQAFRWFRDKYNFEYQIIKSVNGNYSVVIHLNTQEYLDKISTQPHACIEEVTDCYSYEEAELECLIKLIEIIKNK